MFCISPLAVLEIGHLPSVLHLSFERSRNSICLPSTNIFRLLTHTFLHHHHHLLHPNNSSNHLHLHLLKAPIHHLGRTPRPLRHRSQQSLNCHPHHHHLTFLILRLPHRRMHQSLQLPAPIHGRHRRSIHQSGPLTHLLLHRRQAQLPAPHHCHQ